MSLSTFQLLGKGLESALGVSAVGANSLLLVVLIRFSHQLKEIPIAPLIQVLAIFDLLSGLTDVIGDLFPLLLPATTRISVAECLLLEVPGTLTAFSAMFTMLAIAVDRAIAINDPLGYLHLNHRRRAITLFVGLSAYSGCLATAAILTTNSIETNNNETADTMMLAAYECHLGLASAWFLVLVNASLFCFSTLIVGSYALVIYLLYKHQQSTAGVLMEEARTAQLRVTSRMQLLAGMYAVFYLLPVMIFCFTNLFGPDDPEGLFFDVFSVVIGISFGFSSVSNFFLYSCRQTQIRDCIKALFGMKPNQIGAQ